MNSKDFKLLKNSSYINGAWCKGDKHYTVLNPSTKEKITDVYEADEKMITQAVEDAHAALAPWQKRTAAERAGLLRAWFALIMENKKELGTIMTLEQGKPLREAIGEVGYGASFFEWYAEEAKRAYGDITPPPINDRKLLTVRQPVGVVGAITPWNFPNAMIARKAAPALAVGCTIVIKPASLTPLSALALCELAEQAGIPKGVINVVISTNASMAGKILTTHPLIRKFTFTGSTEVGKILMASCVSTVKKVSMELGGNAPFIVFEDADLDKALDALMIAKFRNAGQTCVSAKPYLCTQKVFTIRLNKKWLMRSATLRWVMALTILPKSVL